MDFGLARLAAGEPDDEPDNGPDSPRLPILSVTKTGAIVGTPAYMSPEQFRREATDARSDQFSFCIALHEALYGTRPSGALADTGEPSLAPAPSQPLPRAGVPIWLRGVVRRGASVDRGARYPSMEALLAALERGRKRLRRRAAIAAATVATLLLAGAAWRLGEAHHFACSLPSDRVAAAWAPGAAADARRASIHRAFLASGRPAAETSWQRASRALDDYMNAWSAMYLQACEATNVRGEQSAEVLDLRMSCLGDNLDQVRALTDTLVTADSDAVSHAVAAALEITPVARCANIPLLKSAIPLPRDERTLREVELLRRSLTDVETLREFGRLDAALARAVALRPRVEATGFKPLLGELLGEIGLVQSDMFDLQAAKTLEEAILVSEASHDDVTRARAATSLIYLAGIQHNSPRDAERWFRLTIAIHDRLGPGHERTRAWALQNYGAVLEAQGDFEGAIARTREAITLKEQSVGKDHPDVALSMENLAQALCDADRPQEALAATNRALTILETSSDPGSPMLANALIHKAEALLMLGHRAEARQLLARARDVVRGINAEHPFLASAAEDLGKIELEDGHPTTAIPLLEEAQRVYEKYPGAEALLANTRYALAKAFWERAADRARALPLAESARELYAHSNRARRAQEVGEWIAGHRGMRR
jgi:tetratricopeptide (TPR) repeat protein